MSNLAITAEVPAQQLRAVFDGLRWVVTSQIDEPDSDVKPWRDALRDATPFGTHWTPRLQAQVALNTVFGEGEWTLADYQPGTIASLPPLPPGAIM